MGSGIPVEFVFNPNWWHRNYAVSFDEGFYLDPATRVRNDVLMRRALYERFGLGEPDPKPRPVLGSEHIAGGFVIPALLGVKIRFSASDPPFPLPAHLDDAQALALEVPEIEKTWPMNLILEQARALREEHGYVSGDLNTDGVLNSALHLRGEQLFLDFHDNPELASRLFEVVARTALAVAAALKSATGTCSISVNRSIVNVDPPIFLHANCTLQMISPAIYERLLLPWEIFMAERLQPYGIHHCGSNMHQFARLYARIPAVFYDVGWGSDVAACRRELPHAFLNLRLNPVRMLESSAQEIRADAHRLLAAAGEGGKVGLCCINMDYGTPDENVTAVLEVAEEYGRRLARALRAPSPSCGSREAEVKEDSVLGLAARE